MGKAESAVEALVGGTTPASCRLCRTPLRHVFADLGVSPIANAFVSVDETPRGETFYPLCAYVCSDCWLVQVPVFATAAEIFSPNYAYFSSYSESWLEHARRYAAEATDRFLRNGSGQVVEVASNDGYLLQFFAELGLPVLGVEPAASVAEAARAKGIPTVEEFFGADVAKKLVGEGRRADLLVGNNVLAHVPDIHDFVEGLRILLADEGVLTMEFQHLLRLIEATEFDTIYHEHFSYYSLLAAERLFSEHELTIFDVEQLPTHGGSVRVYVRHAGDATKRTGARVEALREEEVRAGLRDLSTYLAFNEAVGRVKRDLLELLIDIKRTGKSVVGYGAAAKGTTLLNFCGIGADFLDYVVDRNPHKQGHYLPGVRLAILSPEDVHRTRPDYLLILPWNIADEIIEQMSDVREFGCRFIVPIPEPRVVP